MFIGQQVPDFNLRGFHNGEVKEYSRTGYAGKWLVLFSYPADFTYVCPTEVKAFNDHFPDFQKLNTEVVGLSVDSIESHQKWIEQEWGSLAYPLLADIAKDFIYRYAIDTKDEHGGVVALRATFIIDPESKLRYMVVSDNNVGRSIDEILRVLQALQTGKLCPAEWHPGEPTIN